MNDDKLKEIRCQGCNPHFPAKLKRCPKCSSGICSTCMKRNGCNKEVPTVVTPVVTPDVVPKKKHTALKVILIILGILVLLAIIVAILFATGVFGFNETAIVNFTKITVTTTIN